MKAQYGSDLHLEKTPVTEADAPFPILLTLTMNAPESAEAYDISTVKVSNCLQEMSATIDQDMQQQCHHQSCVCLCAALVCVVSKQGCACMQAVVTVHATNKENGSGNYDGMQSVAVIPAQLQSCFELWTVCPASANR